MTGPSMMVATGLSADGATVAFAGAAVALVALVLFHARPRVGLAVWLLVVCFVPVWLGVSAFHLYFYPASAAGILVLFGVAPFRAFRLSAADLVLAVFFVACLVPLVIGGYTPTSVFVALDEWLLGYLLGRLAVTNVGVDRTYRILAVLFSVVAVLAIGEFLLHWNPFQAIKVANSQYAAWGSIQFRGGEPRSEGAFGHSIALSASLAMAIPVTLASSFALRTRVLMVALMVGGVGVSFSRGGMLAAAAGLLISVLFLRDSLSSRARWAVVTGGAAVAAVLIPLVSDTLSASGTEATNSADYRGRLVSLIPDFSVLGYSPIGHLTPAHVLYFGSFRSIDSQLVLTGLTYGWTVVALGVLLLLAGVLLIVTGRATGATIAVVAQVPALATVALITQYQIFFWFMAGLAVCSQVQRGSPLPLDPVALRVGSVPGATTAPHPVPLADLDRVRHSRRYRAMGSTGVGGSAEGV